MCLCRLRWHINQNCHSSKPMAWYHRKTYIVFLVCHPIVWSRGQTYEAVTSNLSMFSRRNTGGTGTPLTLTALRGSSSFRFPNLPCKEMEELKTWSVGDALAPLRAGYFCGKLCSLGVGEAHVIKQVHSQTNGRKLVYDVLNDSECTNPYLIMIAFCCWRFCVFFFKDWEVCGCL